MLYSASSFKSLYQTSGLTDTIYLQSHLKKMMIGFFGMFLFTVMDYRKLKIAAPYILILSIILLMLTKLIYIIKGSSSAARWLDLGVISIQTSDFARFSIIIYFAYYIDKKTQSNKRLLYWDCPSSLHFGYYFIAYNHSTRFQLCCCDRIHRFFNATNRWSKNFSPYSFCY